MRKWCLSLALSARGSYGPAREEGHKARMIKRIRSTQFNHLRHENLHHSSGGPQGRDGKLTPQEVSMLA